MTQLCRGTGYRSSLSDNDAFDMLRPEVREAIRTSVFEWSAAWALAVQRKSGSTAAVARLRLADKNAIAKGWMRGVKSPCVSMRVRPLY